MAASPDKADQLNEEMIMESLASKLTEALDIQRTIFEKKRIQYALIGGLALSYLGNPRFTTDIDFILQIPQLSLPGLLEELLQNNFEFELMQAIRTWTQGNMLVIHYEGFRIDWLKPPLTLHHHVIETASEVTWKGSRIRVATPESIVLLKLIAFRDNDQADIQGLIASHRDKLNLPYIDSEWLTIGELTDPPMVWFKERYQHITSGGS